MASLLKPLRFRFNHAEDVAVYGDRWHTYDESVWTSMPARRLMELETEIGVPLVDVMDGVRAESAFGNLAGTWLAMVVEDGREKAGPFADYNPIVMMIDWERIPDAELEPGKEETPESPESEPSDMDQPPAELPSDDTSPMDTVSLPIMPVSASAT